MTAPRPSHLSRPLRAAGLATLLILIAVPADRSPGARRLGPLASLLALVPATAQTRIEAVVNDYALARRGSGISLPPAGDRRLVEQYRFAMTSNASAGVGCVPAAISLPSFADVAADVSAGGIEVARVRGRFVGRALADQTRSLAAVDDERVLADAFDRAGVYSAAFSTDITRFVKADGALLRYRALATGVGRGRDGPFLAIAFAEPDGASAVENASRLRVIVEQGTSTAASRPWSELLRVDRITTEGRVVLAVLPTRLPLLWIDLERTPDTLLWWAPS